MMEPRRPAIFGTMSHKTEVMAENKDFRKYNDNYK